ncbi:MAG: helix-turn-helix domain-containing protein [Butyrivibrio sp.]|nr:helix-turn-helix domain-containing protein [Butyrivibrio sp.]
MAHPYNEMYLNDAMNNLAEAFQTAAFDYKFDLDFFMSLFINSGIAAQFEVGNPKYIVGKSGAELTQDIVLKTNAATLREIDTSFKAPKENYWTGWVLAYYQWHSAKSFKEINNIITPKEIKEKYNPYHEMDEMQIVDYINSKEENISTINRLQMYRKLLGISQSTLAKESGVNLRTLQQYEIGAKDIHKASASTLDSLCMVLKCDIKDLL